MNSIVYLVGVIVWQGRMTWLNGANLVLAPVVPLLLGAPQRTYHVSDGAEIRMGDHFDAVADAFGLPRPPRLTRARAQATLSPAQMSFLCESRRLDNRRLREELRVRLRYPTPAAAWPPRSRTRA